MADYETRTIVYVTHPDGSPALWMETALDGTRTLIDDGKAPVVLEAGEDIDEAVAQWRVAVGDDEAERDPITAPIDPGAIALPAPMAVRHVRDPRGGVQL